MQNPLGMKIIFFKRPKPRQFNYRPFYYNPETEEAEERRKELEALRSTDRSERMRAEFRRRWKKGKTPPERNTAVFKATFYLIIAGFTVYLIFFTDFINKLVSVFLK